MSRYLGMAAMIAVVSWCIWHFGRNAEYGLPSASTAYAVPAPSPFKDREAGPSDHVMFGGTPGRNMVNLVDKGLPGDFKLDEALLWKAKLGSRAYGNPAIALGRVFCGTNNESPRNNRDRGTPTDDAPEGAPLDKSILMCFAESTGNFLWQAVHDKNSAGQIADWPREGICSTPCVDGRRIYYVSNQCRVVCAGLNGLDAKHNEGFRGEKYRDETDVDIIWEFDMMKELNVFPHNMSNCSPVVVGDLVFVNTSNGVDESHVKVASPNAPSFIALSKQDGKLVWKSNLPGNSIMHGQWSNPGFGVIGDQPQVIFGGGDGWLYSFKPHNGELLWKFDANPKNARIALGGAGTKSEFVGTPVIYKERIFIGVGQDPEHFEGVGHFWCIDPAGKAGDISPELVVGGKVQPNPNSGAVWHYGGDERRKFAKRDYVFGRTMSTAAIVDDVIYIPELAGYLHCLDAKTGKKYWQWDLKSAIWGSAFYADGKVYLGSEDGDLFVFKHEARPAVMDEVEEGARQPDEKSAQKKTLEIKKAVEKRCKIAKIEIEEPIRSTPVVANGVLYVMTEQTLLAFTKK